MMPQLHDQAGPLRSWLAQRRIDSVKVISPHLDDAAFSVAEFLTRPGFGPRQVITVFTEAKSDDAYAQSSGFEDSQQEFESRREEDRRAMARLGVEFRHLGLSGGSPDPEPIQAAFREALSPVDGQRSLVLLPLGAGGQLSQVRRVLRRVRRKPPGCPPHPEHVTIRDLALQTFSRAKPVFGFYADIPYQWANSRRELLSLAQAALSHSPIQSFELKVNRESKLAVVRDYASQVALEFGERASYQRRSVAIPERLYLPEGTSG